MSVKAVRASMVGRAKMETVRTLASVQCSSKGTTAKCIAHVLLSTVLPRGIHARTEVNAAKTRTVNPYVLAQQGTWGHSAAFQIPAYLRMIAAIAFVKTVECA